MPMYAYNSATGHIAAYVFGSPTFRATKEALGLAVAESDQIVDINDFKIVDGEFVEKTDADILPGLKVKKQEELLAVINRFIENKPNGLARYDTNLKFNIMQAGVAAMAAGNPEPEAVTLAKNWLGSAQAKYFELKGAIVAATTVAELEAIDISYETLEAQYGVGGTVLADPDISTADLM